MPEPLVWLLIRGTAVLLFAGLAALRASQFPRYRSKTLWALETLVLALLALAYVLRRDPPLSRARGARAVILPMVGAALPFSLLLIPVREDLLALAWLPPALDALMAAGSALVCWGLWEIRRCFSITVEARGLVTGGPYALVRHPIYAGEIVSALGMALARAGPVSTGILLVFVGIQTLRAVLEEEKMGSLFPEYRAYAQGTGRFWPRLPRRRR